MILPFLIIILCYSLLHVIVFAKCMNTRFTISNTFNISNTPFKFQHFKMLKIIHHKL